MSRQNVDSSAQFMAIDWEAHWRAAIERGTRYVKALREVVAVLGPVTAGCADCCEGCAAEMTEALRIAKEALDG